MNVAATSVTKKDAQAARTPSPANGTVQPPGTAPTQAGHPLGAAPPTQAGHPLGAAPPGRVGGTRRGPAPTTTVAPRGALPSAHPGRLGPMPTGAGRPQVAHRPAAGPTGPARAAHGARAAAQAAAQPGGLRRAGAQRQAAAAPAVPPRPSGQPHQPAQPPVVPVAAARCTGLPPLSVGHHLASREELGHLQLTATTYGLTLGKDERGVAVPLPVLVPTPTSVALIGGWWAARYVAMRALAFGARVVVFTDQPAGWHDLAEHVTGRIDRVVVVPPAARPDVPGTAERPVLLVHDVNHARSWEYARPSSWQTRVSVIDVLTPERAQLLHHADIIVMQRLQPSEASVVAGALGMVQETVSRLQHVGAEELAVLVKPAARHLVRVDLTPRESTVLCRPGRY